MTTYENQSMYACVRLHLKNHVCECVSVCVHNVLVNVDVNYYCGEGKTETSLQILKLNKQTNKLKRHNAMADCLGNARATTARHGSAEH